MPKICYVPKDFTPARMKVIEQADAIIREYERQGYELTLRGLYYQFVSRDLLPNTTQSYKKLGTIVSEGRRAGLLDWDMLVDRTREIRGNQHWTDPKEIIDASAGGFMLNRWKGQENYVEVWFEKDAVLGVIEKITNELDVRFFSCRGYTSDSSIWRAGVRLKNRARDNKTIRIIHLGDHDPSGIDMTRDVQERLSLFAEHSIIVDRIALNMDQVDEYGPPPNPAKMTDSRYGSYVTEYGDESWELDALEPAVMSQIIDDAVRPLIDKKIMDGVEEEENGMIEELTAVSDNWEDIIAHCDDQGWL